MENKTEFVKNAGLWFFYDDACPTCGGSFEPITIEGKFILNHDGFSWFECPGCKEKLILEREGENPEYRFLPREWTPKLKEGTPLFEIHGGVRILAASDCPLHQCEGSLSPIDLTLERPDAPGTPDAPDTPGTYICDDCRGVLTFPPRKPTGFEFISKSEYVERTRGVA